MISLWLDWEFWLVAIVPLLLVFFPWSMRFPNQFPAAALLALLGYYFGSSAFLSDDPSGLQYLALAIALPLYALALSQVRHARSQLPSAAVHLIIGAAATAVTSLAMTPVLDWIAGHARLTADEAGLLLLRGFTGLFVLLCFGTWVVQNVRTRRGASGELPA
jgi:hypothetical protein